MKQGAVVAVVGLGYVGLPLAVEFGKRRPTLGYDRSHGRVEAILRGEDRTGELRAEELRSARQLKVTADAAWARTSSAVRPSTC